MFLFDSVSEVALVVKNTPVSEGDIRDMGSVSGLERSPAGGHGNQLQYSCLANPMDRGAWQAMTHPQDLKESDTTQATARTHT